MAAAGQGATGCFDMTRWGRQCQFAAAIMRFAGITRLRSTRRGLRLVILQRENHALMGWRRPGFGSTASCLGHRRQDFVEGARRAMPAALAFADFEGQAFCDGQSSHESG